MKKQNNKRAINDVAIKYEAAGWSATQFASRAQMDVLATKGVDSKQRVHFVKVFHSVALTGQASAGEDSTVVPNDEENNQYIQNAFSNNAEPIYAYVFYKADKLDKITLVNVNTKLAVRLVAVKKDESKDTSKDAIKDATKEVSKESVEKKKRRARNC
jgi:uncharacterized protein with PhoU and TrkA domain